MATENGYGCTPNIVVGLALTVAGIVLTLDTLDMVNARELVRFWPVFLILFGASVVVQALQRGPDGAPAGRSQRPLVTPGFVLMFVLVGLFVSNAFQRRADGGSDAGTRTVFTVMSRTTRSSDASPFRGADMTTVMGRSRLDLRDAVLAPGEEAVIDVFGMMGAVDVVVPDDWDVDVETVPVMGRVNDRRMLPARSGDDPGITPPRVVVRGFIMMGALNIES